MEDVDPRLTPLLESVAEEARREADQILREARGRVETRRSETERRSQEILAAAQAAGEAEGQRVARRHVALAEIEARQILLGARAEQVETSLERALDGLHERLSGDERGRLLGAWVEAATRVLDESKPRVQCREEDAEALRSALAGRALEVHLACDLAEPGVVVATADGRRRVVLTPRSLLERRGEEARRAAAAVLFPPEVRA